MQIYFYYRDAEYLIEKLDRSTQTKTLRILELLEAHGPNIGMPHSRALGNGLYELRIRGTREVRLFYTFHKDMVVILYGFIKTKNKLPLPELHLALRRKRQLELL